jgi:cell division protein FtsA
VAEQAGLRELAEHVLDLPVRIGEPQGVERLDERLSGPAFATAVGLLLWAEQHGTAARLAGSAGLRLPQAAGRAGRWLRGFLP